MSDDESARYLEWATFTVDEIPRCMWGEDLRTQNQAFLEGLDATFFNYAAKAHLNALEGESRQQAALSIRLVYAQALETLFALLCAALQAPHCPLGWILSYRNPDLYSVVRKLINGEAVLAPRITDLSWNGISEYINRFRHPDEQEDTRIKTLFADTWAQLAYDLVNEQAIDEYNSIKHGFRVRAEGFDLTFRSQEPGEPVLMDSRSEFGTRSYHVERLSPDRVNFYAQDMARNWNPIALAVRVELIVVSIANTVSFLHTTVGSNKEEVRFEWPEETESLQLAWNVGFVVESLRGGVQISPEDIAPKTKAEILRAHAAVQRSQES